MILNNTPQHEAILSNVGAIGEFRIRNSAKAFSILSSGLYANKIRAIIRELSCNAVDSHVEAGKADTPFDIHLPNTLEPWFSIRDYGTGLSHDQVTQIYTTYFESTKADSNAFIGALGLGSKSPFSYTDNFTVTAIKNGRRGIYSAFINDAGVPSIALMMEEASNVPAGVEVKFSVNDRYDFSKFIDEAKYVYTYFKLRPVVAGCNPFKFTEIKYADKDIIPGGHVQSGTEYGQKSKAIMGNIAYPIDVPGTDKTLGEYRSMLDCRLELHFNIGELDFQASREGLSYIPSTIEAIKLKLETLSARLSVRLAEEANKIDNLWERADYVVNRHKEPLWKSAATKYVVDTKCPLVDFSNSGNYQYNKLHQFNLLKDDLAKKYNIVIRGFHCTNDRGIRTNKPTQVSTTVPGATTCSYTEKWTVDVSLSNYFVFNDTKVGALQRAKYHWKNETSIRKGSVYVIEPADRKQPILKDMFLKDLMNPPNKQVFIASTLRQPVRVAGLGRNVTILQLEERSTRRGRWNSEKKMVWVSCDKTGDFDKSAIYYYLPVKGFESLGTISSVKAMHTHLKNSGVYTGTVYGVRKGDIEYIKTQKNWVNLDDHVVSVLSKLGTENIMGLVKQSIDFETFSNYKITSLISVTSPIAKFINEFKNVPSPKGDEYSRSVQFLCQAYNITTLTNTDPTALIKKWEGVVSDLYLRYPLLKHLDGYQRRTDDYKEAIAGYVNLVDSSNV